jgi:nucleoside-diphosphate-sugar epimerase
MRIAITGANGFVGRHLVAAARARGHEVVGVVRRPHEHEASRGLSWVHGDLEQPDSLHAAFEGADVVVANAALAPGMAGGTPEAFRVANVEGARHQVACAARSGVRRVIYLSTVAVYRTRLLRPLGEAGERLDPDRPGFDWNHLTTDPGYALSKAAAERAVWAESASRGVALTALRPGPIYGPGDHKITERYLAMIERRVPRAPTVRVPHAYARDVADAALAAAERPFTAGRAYNLAGESVPVHRAVQALASSLGLGRVWPVPVPLGVAFDDRAARRDLGFTPRSVEQGMAATAAWWRAKGR